VQNDEIGTRARHQGRLGNPESPRSDGSDRSNQPIIVNPAAGKPQFVKDVAVARQDESGRAWSSC